MSKGGGAGKVYFVLYLAVVLELLIIIVERDEAEEGLLRKQKETMKIVESILSQLQSGAGTEGINTRPQDEITVMENVNKEALGGVEIKDSRKYIVEVGVTDITSALQRKEGETEKEYVQRLKKLIELGNVEELEYQIFFNSSTDPTNAPLFISDDNLLKQKIEFTKWQPGQTLNGEDGSEWKFMGVRKLVLDKETTFNNLSLDNLKPENIHPYYPKDREIVIGPNYAPPNIPEDSIFYYSEVESRARLGISGGEEMQKRAFVVNFRPNNQPGWYKLRFSSRTNRILGVRSDVKPDEMDDETTVNIGTVQLTVKDLRKVKKELQSKLEKYKLPSYEDLANTGDYEKFDNGLKDAIAEASKGDEATDNISKLKLYGYIAKLLAPGMSSNFSQNRGAIEFNIRVITPKPQIADPVITITNYTGSFDKVPAVFEFQISPYQGETANQVEGRIVDNNGATVARVDCRPLDKIAGVSVTPPVNGGRREYRGTATEELAPGKYKIELTHKLGGKAKMETAELEIFKTGLTDESRRNIENRMNVLAQYGYPVSIEAMPNCGGKIKSNQFRLYLYTDANNQPTPVEGLSNTDNPLRLGCESNKVNLKITWVQPYTNQEIDIYPLKSYEIRQEAPEITSSGAPEFSGTANKVRISVSGISISNPTSGCNDKVEVKYRLGKPNKIDGLKTYDPSIEPTIEKEGDGYRVYIELSGKLERGERKVNGTLTIPIVAWAINPNGKVSEEVEFELPIKINWEPGTQQRDQRKPR